MSHQNIFFSIAGMPLSVTMGRWLLLLLLPEPEVSSLLCHKLGAVLLSTPTGARVVELHDLGEAAPKLQAKIKLLPLDVHLLRNFITVVEHWLPQTYYS